ncbi:hypothetical protein EMIHUDRAFT_368053 [Emiliania huxleyi CCMP1516]|uniref:Uncharacterized protein n=2 Tax=Emiliania huxleyi TaxID=2903 RepID=A0A0D3JJ61_EMIH1|nr:hypothetical protein EMIHUDRAFT_368053 [Emiliania huxleyi CCMP1516]EOD23546.1 hypothetical protein EMIHUDRAFT_368053 [Emiliania huxleyi CCMP1516]|eukprot:XP_005775975.1 hypothetical protein EMIHUDRAFT_368053 [Emiliania huxleyi CCMP1516]
MPHPPIPPPSPNGGATRAPEAPGPKQPGPRPPPHAGTPPPQKPKGGAPPRGGMCGCIPGCPIPGGIIPPGPQPQRGAPMPPKPGTAPGGSLPPCRCCAAGRREACGPPRCSEPSPAEAGGSASSADAFRCRL